MSNKKYQIFVSSTYEDLKEERMAVLTAILDMGHIPAGFENFPAIDEEVLKYIYRIIDESDYYVLILGARYGSVDREGISYIEREYDYAVKQQKKVIALIHVNPEEIERYKTDNNKKLYKKLLNFRNKVMTGRLVSLWHNKNDLVSKFISSIIQDIGYYSKKTATSAASVAAVEAAPTPIAEADPVSAPAAGAASEAAPAPAAPSEAAPAPAAGAASEAASDAAPAAAEAAAVAEAAPAEANTSNSPKLKNDSEIIGKGTTPYKREADNIVLNFEKYADIISKIFINSGKDLTKLAIEGGKTTENNNDDKRYNDFSFALLGKWGTGKTVLMKKIIEKLEEEQYLPVTVNCWKYKELPALWANLYEEILECIKSYYNWHEKINILSQCKIDLYSLITHLIFLLTLYFLPVKNKLKIQYAIPLILIYYLFKSDVVCNISRMLYNYLMHLFNFSSHSNLLGMQYNIVQDIQRVILSCTQNNTDKWYKRIFSDKCLRCIIFISWIDLILTSIASIIVYKVIIEVYGNKNFMFGVFWENKYLFFTPYMLVSIAIYLIIFYFLRKSIFMNAKHKKILLVFDNLDRCPGSEMLDIIEHIIQLLDDSTIKKYVQIAMLIEEDNLRVALAKKYLDVISSRNYQDGKQTDRNCSNYKYFKELYSNIVNENLEKFFICTFRLNELSGNDYDEIVQKYVEEMKLINEPITTIEIEKKNESKKETDRMIWDLTHILQLFNGRRVIFKNLPKEIQNAFPANKILQMRNPNLNIGPNPITNTNNTPQNERMIWEEKEKELLINYLKQETDNKTPRHVRSIMFKYLIARELIYVFNLNDKIKPQDILNKFKEFYDKKNENKSNNVISKNGNSYEMALLDKIINMVA